MESKDTREATHSGSWYEGDPEELKESMESMLKKVVVQEEEGVLRGIISPHAGYTYCLPVAVHSYCHIKPSNYNRVLVMGPSHHVYLDGLALPQCKVYKTPFGNIEIDLEEVERLSQMDKFFSMKKKVDEEEHSLEMQYPILKHMMGEHKFKLLPIMVGNLTEEDEEYFGNIIKEYAKDKKTLFVVSSDFCHWGKRFKYTYYKKDHGAIHQSIERLDREGMKLIEKHDSEGFHNYLEITKNTICGRNPIALFIRALNASGLSFKTKFVNYAQSGKVTDPTDSSVSYATSVTYQVE